MFCQEMSERNERVYRCFQHWLENNHSMLEAQYTEVFFCYPRTGQCFILRLE